MARAKPTETAEITVAYVNDPKPGKKWGNVKDTAGVAYFGPPGMLKQFQPGETCKIEFELGGNDGTLRSLKHKVSTTPAALVRQATPPPRARTNPTDSEQMFVTALLKDNFNLDQPTTDLIARVNKLRDVYRNTFGGSERNRADDMADEIPY